MGQESICYLCEAVSLLDPDNGRAKGQWLLPCQLHLLYPAGKDLLG